MLSVNCKYCSKTNFVNFDQKEKLFCNDFCKINFYKNKEKNSICINCGKEFNHNGEKVLCSKNCCVEYAVNLKIFNKNNCKMCDSERNDGEIFCKSCISKTQNDFFYNFLINSIFSKSKLVKKTWGMEVIISNNNNYCLKYLIFYKNQKMSYHFHEIKTELWHCIHGNFDCIIEKNKEKINFSLNAGDKIEIDPLTKHQLIAKENSIIIEVSTKDFIEDSFRINQDI